jgi:uncharacterized protein YciI
MLYMIHCVDKPGHQDLRAANRPAHVAYLKSFGDKLVAAGPTETDDGAAMTGSLIILDCDKRADAEAFCRNDPYAKAGLFERVEVSRWKRVLPAE